MGRGNIIHPPSRPSSPFKHLGLFCALLFGSAAQLNLVGRERMRDIEERLLFNEKKISVAPFSHSFSLQGK